MPAGAYQSGSKEAILHGHRKQRVLSSFSVTEVLWRIQRCLVCNYNLKTVKPGATRVPQEILDMPFTVKKKVSAVIPIKL